MHIYTYIFIHAYTYIHTYMFVVVNFDALAQANDIRIERRQVVFLCWMQDSNPSGSQTPNGQQTECPLTNRQYIYMKVNQYIYIYTLVYICIYILFLSVSHSHPHPPPPSFLSCWMHTSPVFMRNPSVDYNSAEQALKRGSSGFMSVEK